MYHNDNYITYITYIYTLINLMATNDYMWTAGATVLKRCEYLH